MPSGVAAQRLKKYGKVYTTIGLSKFDNSILGYYKGWRWLLLIREIFLIIPTIISIYQIKNKSKSIDIVHFNEVTLIPTLFFFKLFFSVPFIMHCRILFKKDNYFGKKIAKFLEKNIFQIIAIDNDVKESFPKFLNVKVVRNIFIKKKIKKNKTFFNDNFLNIGYVGSFLKFKGIEDLIIVFNKLKINGYNIRLYLAGNFIKNKKIFDFFGISNNIDKKLTLSKDIINMGHINKLDKFYDKIDLLCFPSYLNALGRQIFEAGHYQIPSIVCIDKTKTDSFINKKSGLSFKKPGSKNKLEEIIKYFYENRSEVSKMGLNAHKIILKNYDINKNLFNLENIYNKALKN